jgi:hypothetical protein
MAGGRPNIYTNPVEMQRLVDLYFLACRVHLEMQVLDEPKDRLEGLPTDDLLVIDDIEDVYPTISGLAYTLDMTTETLRTYALKDEFSATVKKAKQRVEMSLEQRLSSKAVIGSIFSLKNNFNWKDKTEVANTHRLGDVSDDELDKRIKVLENELNSQD